MWQKGRVPDAGLKVPTGQGTATVDPVGQYEPIGHG
jgi:hypothetical protein